MSALSLGIFDRHADFWEWVRNTGCIYRYREINLGDVNNVIATSVGNERIGEVNAFLAFAQCLPRGSLLQCLSPSTSRDRSVETKSERAERSSMEQVINR